MSKLQAELKKRNNFDSVEQEAILNILRTSDQIQNFIGRLLREFELTSSQYNVLRILRGEGKPMPCLEVAQRMIQVVPAITGLIDRLEAAGMVARRRCENDRRVVYIEITAAAQELLSKIDAPLAALHKDLLKKLTKAELQDVVRLMEKTREGFR